MIYSKTPLRISLFGGGTDFPEYFKKKKSIIIGGSINKFIYIFLNKFYSQLFEENIRLIYKNHEFIKSLKDIKHKAIREIFKKNNLNKNIELHIVSDLPGNTGLGSSSSFSVGLINCINKLKKKNLSKAKLASYVINFERKILKENVGYQDQIFATYGGFARIEIKKSGNFSVKHFKNKSYIKKIEKNLFLIFSGITRSASEIEKKKIKKIKKNKKILDQIVEISRLAEKKILSKENPDFIGHFLNRYWQLKKQLDEKVTSTKIDNLYKLCTKNGASGGKLLGAGNGGFMLFYVPSNKHNQFRKKLKNRIIDFKFNNQGSKTQNINDK